MKYLLLLSPLLLIGTGCDLSKQTSVPAPTITTFESCVAAGNPIIKTNPPRCEHEGEVFTLKLDAQATTTPSAPTTTETDISPSSPEPIVTNFDECVAAGNPVMESYPEQCRHGGTTYVNQVAAPLPPAPPLAAGIHAAATAVDTGIAVSWEVTGDIDTSQGFKVVYSLSANPTYGTDTSAYISSPSARSHTLDLADGKTYHIRVCTYTGDGCTNYSSNVSTRAPQKHTTAEPKNEQPTITPEPSVKQISLNAGAENIITWQTTGDASMGFKIAYSKHPNPVYPKRNEEDNWIFVWDPNAAAWELPAEQGAGTYYVRVCEYIGNACGVYSNEISIELQ